MTANESVRCILCRSTNVSLVETLSADDIHRTWESKYQIPVRHYFPAGSTSNFKCRTCGLDFFHPPSPGDAQMYQKLQQFPWYYEEAKWEFAAAQTLLRTPGTVLEIGCGTGNFLAQLIANGFTDVSGLDSNEDALATAAQRGIKTFSDISQLAGRTYDYVVAFQVLEHVPDPRSFLESLARLTSHRGKILVAVPNQGGFIGDGREDVLNQPPHHCARFGAATLKRVEEFIPLKLETIACEPLSAQHIGWFVSVRMMRLVKHPFLYRAAWKFAGPIAERALKLGRLRRLFWGHSVLAVYHSTRMASALGAD